MQLARLEKLDTELARKLLKEPGIARHMAEMLEYCKGFH